MIKQSFVFTLALALSAAACDRGGDEVAKPSPEAAAEPGKQAAAEPAKKEASSPDGSQATPPEAPVTAEPGTGATIPGWIVYESKEGRFVVELPSTPERSTVPVPTAVGNLDLESYMAQQGEDVFMVMTVDYPADIVAGADPQGMLDGARDGAVANVAGTLASEKQLTIDGHPARRLRITGRSQGIDVTLDATLCLAGNRLYQVIASSATGLDPTTLDRFMASFQPRAA